MARVLGFCVLVLILVGTVALYRHWINVSTESNAEGPDSVKITVDRDKAKEDLGSVPRAAKKAEEGVKKEVARWKGSATMTGKVADIDPAHKQVTLKNDKETVELQVNDHTDIRVGDKEAHLDDLHLGETATASYAATGKDHTARSITVAK